MDVTVQKTALLKRRADLNRRLLETERSLDETPPKDWEDRSSERQGDEVLERLGHMELDEVKRIDAALDRIAAGDYGICRTCDGPISDARLDLLPDTPFCKRCAA